MKTIVKGKAEKFWERETVVAVIPEHSTAVRVAICEKDGEKFVDVRKFVKAKGSDKFDQHTTKGISLPLSNEEALGSIIEAMISTMEPPAPPKPVEKPVDKVKARWSSAQKKAAKIGKAVAQ